MYTHLQLPKMDCFCTTRTTGIACWRHLQNMYFASKAHYTVVQAFLLITKRQWCVYCRPTGTVLINFVLYVHNIIYSCARSPRMFHVGAWQTTLRIPDDNSTVLPQDCCMMHRCILCESFDFGSFHVVQSLSCSSAVAITITIPVSSYTVLVWCDIYFVYVCYKYCDELIYSFLSVPNMNIMSITHAVLSVFMTISHFSWIISHLYSIRTTTFCLPLGLVLLNLHFDSFHNLIHLLLLQNNLFRLPHHTNLHILRSRIHHFQ